MESGETERTPEKNHERKAVGHGLFLDSFRASLRTGDFRGARNMLQAPGIQGECLDAGLLKSLKKRLGLDPLAVAVWVACLVSLLSITAMTLIN